MKRIVGLFPIILAVASSPAATIRVPEDYSDIHAAINAANQSGDEVVISPGLYVQPSFTIHKNITLRSTFDGSNWDLVRNTVIKISGNSSMITFEAVSRGVVRGLTLTRDPITPPPNTFIGAQGITATGGNIDIEYNIIENNVYLSGQGGPGPPFIAAGGAISGITGVIQNNIIRNNRADAGAAMYRCDGPIRNNIIYSNSSGLSSCNGPLISNTLYDTGGIAAYGGTTIVNNVFWRSDSQPFFLTFPGPPPMNCVIKGWTGAGQNIITADPQFVDPANADFHLKPNSPCIDAGAVTSDVTADFSGVQRGLKAIPSLPGTEPRYDIGAYEFIPTPVAVWLPNGGPAMISAGDTLAVAWQMDVPTAGTAIYLNLYDDTSFVSAFGVFFSPTGMATSRVALPASLPTKSTYFIRGVSSFDIRLTNVTPLMTILGGPNAVRVPHWSGYP